MTPSERYFHSIESVLNAAGFDLVHPFVIDANVDAIFAFPRFDRDACLGLMIGNGRALWPRFTAWYLEQVAPLRQLAELKEHPLNHYVEQTLTSALGSAVPAQVFYAHRLDYPVLNSSELDSSEKRAGVTAVPMQRLGEAVGVASLGPAHLSAHPVFGPWFAYRAVVALDLPPLVTKNTPRVSPCRECPAPCRDRLNDVLARHGTVNVHAHWQDWVSVRDACPQGRTERYSEEQIWYHYALDRRGFEGGAGTVRR